MKDSNFQSAIRVPQKSSTRDQSNNREMNSCLLRNLIQKGIDVPLTKQEEADLERFLRQDDGLRKFQNNIIQVVASTSEMELPDYIVPRKSENLHKAIITSLPKQRSDWQSRLADLIDSLRGKKPQRHCYSVGEFSPQAQEVLVAIKAEHEGRTSANETLSSGNKQSTTDTRIKQIARANQSTTGQQRTSSGSLRNTFGPRDSNQKIETVPETLTLADAIRRKIHEAQQQALSDATTDATENHELPQEASREPEQRSEMPAPRMPERNAKTEFPRPEWEFASPHNSRFLDESAASSSPSPYTQPVTDKQPLPATPSCKAADQPADHSRVVRLTGEICLTVGQAAQVPPGLTEPSTAITTSTVPGLKDVIRNRARDNDRDTVTGPAEGEHENMPVADAWLCAPPEHPENVTRPLDAHSGANPNSVSHSVRNTGQDTKIESTSFASLPPPVPPSWARQDQAAVPQQTFVRPPLPLPSIPSRESTTLGREPDVSQPSAPPVPRITPVRPVSALPISELEDRIDNLLKELPEEPQANPSHAPHAVDPSSFNPARDCLSATGRIHDTSSSNHPQGTIRNFGRFLLDNQAEQSIGNMIASGLTKSKLRVITLEIARQLEEVLKPVERFSGVIGSAVIGYDGMLIMSTLPPEFDLETMSNCALVSYMNTQNIMDVVGNRKLEQMVFKTSFGYAILGNFGGGLIVTLTDFGDSERIESLLSIIKEVTAH